MKNDYTRAAFAHFQNVALHFWSGPAPLAPGASNLDATATKDVDSNNEESGCTIAISSRGGQSGAFPWRIALLLPVIPLLRKENLKERSWPKIASAFS